jgi:hypothetical protein
MLPDIRFILIMSTRYLAGRLPHGFSATHDHPQLNNGGFDALIAVLNRHAEQGDSGCKQDGNCGICGELRMTQRYASLLCILVGD